MWLNVKGENCPLDCVSGGHGDLSEDTSSNALVWSRRRGRLGRLVGLVAGVWEGVYLMASICSVKGEGTSFAEGWRLEGT